MIKYFPSCATPSSHALHARRINTKRLRAIECAADGGFYESIALLTEAFEMMPKMPEPFEPHEDILYAIRQKMDAHFERESREMLVNHDAVIRDIVRSAGEEYDVTDALTCALETHARNVRVMLDLSVLLRTSSIIIDSNTVTGLDLECLSYLKRIFRDSFPQEDEDENGEH